MVKGPQINLTEKPFPHKDLKLEVKSDSIKVQKTEKYLNLAANLNPELARVSSIENKPNTLRNLLMDYFKDQHTVIN